MITSRPEEPTKEQGADLGDQIERELNELQERIGPRFRRAEVRERAGRIVEGLLANLPRKNG
jgi:hypothetical protein